MDIECIYSGTERKYISEFLSLANIAGFLFSPFFLLYDNSQLFKIFVIFEIIALFLF